MQLERRTLAYFRLQFSLDPVNWKKHNKKGQKGRCKIGNKQRTSDKEFIIDHVLSGTRDKDR